MRKYYFGIFLFAILTVGCRAQASPGYTKIGNSSTSSFTDTSCPNQSTCYYQVTTVDSTGAESVPASCATTQLCLNGNSAAVAMPSSGTHTVIIAWIPPPAPVGGGSNTFAIYRHIGPLPGTSETATVN